MPRFTMLAVLLALAAAAPAPAQTVAGAVVEDGTGAPIPGVSVRLAGRGGAPLASAVTDGAGAFALVAGRPGPVRLHLRHPGYAAVDAPELELEAGEAVEVELRMGRRAIPLEPLRVTARVDRRLVEFRERAARGGFGRFVTREQIGRRRGARPTELLRGLAGVEVVPASRLGGAPNVQLVTLRAGAGRCLPTLYLDGVAMGQSREMGVDQVLAPGVLEGVEVYPGGAAAPAPLLDTSGCGVVAFWTRDDAGRPWSWKRLLAALALLAGAVLLAR